MAVIIPNDVLTEAGVHEGDVLKLAIPVPAAKASRQPSCVMTLRTAETPLRRNQSYDARLHTLP